MINHGFWESKQSINMIKKKWCEFTTRKTIAKIKIAMNMSINTKTNMKAKMDAGKTLITWNHNRLY